MSSTKSVHRTRKVNVDDVMDALLQPFTLPVHICGEPWVVMCDELVGMSEQYKHYRAVLVDSAGHLWAWFYGVPQGRIRDLNPVLDYGQDEDGNIELIRVTRTLKTITDYVVLK